MVSERLYNKILLNRIKKEILSVEGVTNTEVIEFLSFDTEEIYTQISKFYQHHAKGIYIKTHDENGIFYHKDYQTILSEYLGSILSKNIRYYISYEKRYFFQFEIINFKKFIGSFINLNKTYDLTVFNQNEILVINDNEYEISIHYKKS